MISIKSVKHDIGSEKIGEFSDGLFDQERILIHHILKGNYAASEESGLR